ncbi:hypothetical protein F5X96DRAFT_620055 [Biscogniauxia mediterranea]|nr:hypothetical protein F5X96DRAFT_620055 [Biscogniauxia mediterranea]
MPSKISPGLVSEKKRTNSTPFFILLLLLSHPLSSFVVGTLHYEVHNLGYLLQTIYMRLLGSGLANYFLLNMCTSFYKATWNLRVYNDTTTLQTPALVCGEIACLSP